MRIKNLPRCLQSYIPGMIDKVSEYIKRENLSDKIKVEWGNTIKSVKYELNENYTLYVSYNNRFISYTIILYHTHNGDVHFIVDNKKQASNALYELLKILNKTV